jgi:ferritin-like metal-binding protein YciE
MADAKDRYILHLEHAFAMENALVDHLASRASEVDMPDVKLRIQQHQKETMGHRETVRGILTALGREAGDAKANVQPPITPSMIGKVKTAIEAEKLDREIMKGIADYSVEHYEAGIYKGLGEMARDLGYIEHAQKFSVIKEQEEEMARYLENTLPKIVDQAFSGKAA